MKLNLPKKETYFVVFRYNKMENLVEKLKEIYKIPEEELGFLNKSASKLKNCNTLYWIPNIGKFNYVYGVGRFLEYNWCQDWYPEVLAYEGEELYNSNTDKLDTSIFYDLEKSLSLEENDKIWNICKTM